MRKYLVITLVILWVAALLPRLNKGSCLFNRGAPAAPQIISAQNSAADKQGSLKEALRLLKVRKDAQALFIFEKILLTQPDNIEALWGKAEIYRRKRKFSDSEELLKRVFILEPGYAPGLITLSYIRYKQDDLVQAIKLANQALACRRLSRENEALANMMLGTISGGRCSKGWLLDKIIYGSQAKGYFLKTIVLAPDLAEGHLGMGTFYLKASAIAGGDLDKAIWELKLALDLAPDFATANAYLAQAYKKKGDLLKYNFYLNWAKALDPGNEALREE